MPRKKTSKGNLEGVIREQAFQLYKRLGSLKRVAEVPGMPNYATLLRWKEEDRWDERIEKIKENLEKWEAILAKIENDGLVKDDVAQLMFLNFLFEKTVKAILEKNLEPTTWREAMETIKMIFEQKRILLGRATSKSEIDIDFTSMDEHEIRETLRKINELLHGVSSPSTPEGKVKELVKQKIELEKALLEEKQIEKEGAEIKDNIEDTEEVLKEMVKENTSSDEKDDFLDEILEEVEEEK